MSEAEPRSAGFPWGATLTGLLLLAILGALVGIPMLLKSRREARYREATGGLRVLAAAESEFYTNDRDGNGVKDYWTGDVAGLSSVRSARSETVLRLIEPELAHADAQPLVPLAPAPEARSGYLFRALDQDNNGRGQPDWGYRRDTDGSGRKVHHTERFGFCSYPVEGGPGRPMLVVNEYHIVWHRMDGVRHFNWPDDYELKFKYSRFDY